jgi:hypothetical protein
VDDAASATTTDATARVRELEAALVAERAALAAERERTSALAAERDRLREAYHHLQLELELMRRRLFVAKAERVDTAQLELEFADKLAALDALGRRIDPAATGSDAPATAGDASTTESGAGRDSGKRKPTGRRDLREVDLPEERVELADPVYEGQAERIGSEESCQVRWRRGGFVRLVVARVKYRDVDESVPASAAAPAGEMPATEVAPTAAGEAQIPAMSPIVTAPMPPTILPRSIATPSLIAHIASDKFCDGLPLHRQEDRFARLGFRIDRGTMCRWLEDVGMTVGATVVAAMREEALRTAFCIATDATGVLVQPIKGGDQPRRGCHRGHYLVQIADADHVFFEYMPHETSAAIGELFRGFHGYVQADAKSVYDFLYKPPGQRPVSDGDTPDLAERHEVGCWSHNRRGFWEAAITTKDPVAREGLARIGRIFALDRGWRGRPPAEIKALRDLELRPHVDAFFAWAEVEYDKVKDRRGMLRSALGYACRQNGALTRFFDDGRLRLDNNRSERELRRIAVGRKAWLFVGSDDHAQAAGNLLSLVASARLHGLDPEVYLRDLFRVLPQWPMGRYLELAPKYWPATRARLDPDQLEAEVGWLTVPPPPPSEQPATS